MLISIISSCSSNRMERYMNVKAKANYVLEEMINDSNTPGIQYLIVNPDSTIFEFNGGLSNLENKTTLTSATTFNAFSVTKTFTALAILQLEQEGKLNIDDPIAKYLDYFPYKTYFTIHQALNHTSGLPNPIPLKWIHLLSEKDNFNQDDFIKTVLSENNELDNEPGEKYSYSNIGYLLLGEVIKKVSGEDYRDYILNKIVRKLNLEKDEFLGFNIPDTKKHAHGYIKKWSFLNLGFSLMIDKSKYMDDSYEGWSQFKYYYMNGYSFGGLVGNAGGFAKYLQALLKDDVLIGSKSKSKLFEDQKTKGGKNIEMCLSWFKGNLGDEVYYAHAGGGGGYYCEIRIYPKKKLASVIMFNRTGVSDERFLDNIDKFFLPKGISNQTVL